MIGMDYLNALSKHPKKEVEKPQAAHDADGSLNTHAINLTSNK